MQELNRPIAAPNVAGSVGTALLGTIVPAMRAPVDPLRAIRTD